MLCKNLFSSSVCHERAVWTWLMGYSYHGWYTCRRKQGRDLQCHSQDGCRAEEDTIRSGRHLVSSVSISSFPSFTLFSSYSIPASLVYAVDIADTLIEFAQVGNDLKATRFLEELDNHPQIGGLIDCTSNFETEQAEMMRKNGIDLSPEMWLVSRAVISPRSARKTYFSTYRSNYSCELSHIDANSGLSLIVFSGVLLIRMSRSFCGL